jgi:peptidoglycan/LPS O-acetylase OafA/YrhL
MELRKLNTIRGYAAFLVVLAHYSNRFSLFGGLFGAGGGRVGVCLFFVLSGFLMAYLYLGTPFTARSCRNFIVARVARIAPLFVLLVLISFVLCQVPALAPWQLYGVADVEDLVAHLTLLRGQALLWTIPVEIHFYAFFLILWAVRSRWGGRRAAGMLLTILALIWYFQLQERPYECEVFGVQARILTLSGFSYFAAGVLIGWSYRAPQQPGVWACVPLVLLMLLAPQVYRGLVGEEYSLFGDLWVVAFIALCFAIPVTFYPEGGRLLCNRFGDFTGAISFSTYLTHAWVFSRFPKAQLQEHPLLWFLPVYAAVLSLGAVIHYGFERPARSWVRRRLSAGGQAGKPYAMHAQV